MNEVSTPNSNDLLGQLPSESLVPFECRRLKAAATLFKNPYLDTTDDELEQLKFSIPTDETADQFGNERKVFYGERYGGALLANNGGGVRCGISGRYLVKGIGRNVLAGEGTGFWHSHGGASLTEGLLEAVWGEVFHRALPHGAVRVPAVMATGNTCWEKDGSGTGGVESRGVLIAREAALRPAHFFRAAYYRPSPYAKKHLAHDTDRTRAAVQRLPELLPRPASIEPSAWASLPAVKRLELGLLEVTRRFAGQLARARARRLMHGGLSCSNICLDGRWLDVGSASALSCYANCQMNLELRPFWEDHFPVYRTLNDFCFYSFKYFETPNKNALPSSDSLRLIFFRHFEQQLQQEFLLLTGYPRRLLAPHWNAKEARRMAELLFRLARSGHWRASPGIVDDSCRSGDYDVNQILFVAAAATSESELESTLTPLLANTATRAEFVEAYVDFKHLLAKENETGSSWSPSALRRLVLLRSHKAQRNLHCLYRHHLAKEISRLTSLYPNPSEFRVMSERLVTTVCRDVELLFEDSEHGTELWWQNGSSRVFFDVDSGAWVEHERGRDVRYAWEEAFSEHARRSSFVQARLWWGESLLGALQ